MHRGALRLAAHRARRWNRPARARRAPRQNPRPRRRRVVHPHPHGPHRRAAVLPAAVRAHEPVRAARRPPRARAHARGRASRGDGRPGVPRAAVGVQRAGRVQRFRGRGDPRACGPASSCAPRCCVTRNGATGYRIEHARPFALLRHRHRAPPGRRDANILELVRGADVFVYDSTYTDAELPTMSGGVTRPGRRASGSPKRRGSAGSSSSTTTPATTTRRWTGSANRPPTRGPAP